MQQHTERRQRKRSLRFNSEYREPINNVAFAPAGAIRTADGTRILERDQVAPQRTTVTADFNNIPRFIITETDVAMSLADGSARNFRRIMADTTMEVATVEMEWHGRWFEYERRNDGEWRRTRRVE